jgi:hypothetical protein
MEFILEIRERIITRISDITIQEKTPICGSAFSEPNM